jgi:hypothetical protein
MITRYNRNFCSFHNLFRLSLGTHCSDRARWGSDKYNLLFFK